MKAGKMNNDILIDESIEYQLYEVAHKPAIIGYYLTHKGQVIDCDKDAQRLLDVLDLAKEQDKEIWGCFIYAND